MCLMHKEDKQIKKSVCSKKKMFIVRTKQGEWVACAEKTQTPQQLLDKGF